MINKKEPAHIVKLTKIFNYFIRLRDGKCVTCGRKHSLTCSHLISAQTTTTRWNEINCHCQCRDCNYRHEYQPHIYIRWFVEKFSWKMFTDLCDIAVVNRPLPDTEEAEKLIVIYQTKIKEIEDARHK